MFGGRGSRNQTAIDNQARMVRDNSHKLGSGKLQVVEFGDFQCPACGAAHPNLKRIKSEYASKITFVFRNFPLPSHPHADQAAMAAEAAGAQGKFWEMHDKLYENQTQWSASSDPLGNFLDYAGQIGLDKKKFEDDIESLAFRSVIDQDKADGENLGVASTPTIYVDGKQVKDYAYETLKQAIDAALK